MPFKMPLNNVKNLKAGMRRCVLILLVASAGLASGCDSGPVLSGFDQESWRADERSCRNIRPGLLPQLDQVSEELVGLGHSQVIRILGKPEGKSMEKTGQREYYYYVESGPQCQDKTRYTDANKLVIRFDILDRVNLVTYRK
jgi:outer membrane protein assembly factor BamE (lipoprotein component of BamABCDE complex)